MIKVSHELPISLLDKSKIYNDYEYCLVHLLDKKPEYKKHYMNAKNYDREVLLDNSIFELGKAFDSKEFAKKVEDLQPNYYVVPDSLQECEETISNFKSFTSEYKNLPGLKIGVVQGKTWAELKKCYQFMSEYADYIAISFDYDYYLTTGEPISTGSKLEYWCTGRQQLIDRLLLSGVINFNKPHHLLGCSLAREFSHYTDMPFIRSVDTSNPIVAGIHNLKYCGDLGLKEKPSVKLAELIDYTFEEDDERLEIINYNVHCFKHILCRRY